MGHIGSHVDITSTFGPYQPSLDCKPILRTFTEQDFRFEADRIPDKTGCPTRGNAVWSTEQRPSACVKLTRQTWRGLRSQTWAARIIDRIRPRRGGQVYIFDAYVYDDFNAADQGQRAVSRV